MQHVLKLIFTHSCQAALMIFCSHHAKMRVAKAHACYFKKGLEILSIFFPPKTDTLESIILLIVNVCACMCNCAFVCACMSEKEKESYSTLATGVGKQLFLTDFPLTP